MSDQQSKEALDRWLERLLRERLGGTWRIYREHDAICLQLVGAEGQIRFETDGTHSFWESKEEVPHAQWDAVSEGWHSVIGGPLPAPGLIQSSKPLITSQGDSFIVRYNVLGMFAWVLLRLEEIDSALLDSHGRFTASGSHAFRNGYLSRPVVDEWFDILRQLVVRQWPGLPLIRHAFVLQLSHDVDRPSRYGFATTTELIRRAVADAVRGKVANLVVGPWVRATTRSRLSRLDPLNTFDWLMSQSEALGVRSAFYFICGGISDLDADYTVEHPAMRRLLGDIHRRGHEIGLHPSYNSYESATLLRGEADRLRAACSDEGIELSTVGARMHYLRWAHPSTLRHLDVAGIAYDNTLTFPDQAGFRCGTCFEYPGFDPVQCLPLRIRVRPLVAMEMSVLGAQYMGCSGQEALQVFADLKNKCRKVGGSFSLLWHNSALPKNEDLYRTVLDL